MLKKRVAVRPIIVTASGVLQRNGDNTYPFRQDSSFWYLTGINEPDMILVITSRDEYLVVPHKSFERVAFDGATDNETLAQISGIGKILDEKKGWQRLTKDLKKAKSFATLAPAEVFEKRHGFYTNPTRRVFIKRIRDINHAIGLEDIRLDMAYLRMVKQPEELKAIQKAIRITEDTLQEVITKVNSFEYEFEIEAMLTAGYRKRGADGIAFPHVVASGKNAATIHSMANNSRLFKNALLCLDTGAEVENYAADITRTVAIGKVNKRTKQVYQAVQRVHEYALTILKPGVTIRDNEHLIEECMGKELQSLGLIDDLERSSIRRYYPHATSHYLGLDVHDMGDYDKLLEPNMVLTVEPGIYIPEEGIGARIEDDVMITEKGIRILSSGLPRDLH